jgi:hypothetical protein
LMSTIGTFLDGVPYKIINILSNYWHNTIRLNIPPEKGDSMRKVTRKQLAALIYITGAMMTIIATVVSLIQTKSIIKAIKKYSPYN